MPLAISRTKVAAFAVLAFAGGILFASSMDWTSRLFAQGGAPRPTAEQVRTLADASNAFVTISEHITPAVVSVQAERDVRAAPRRQMQVPPGFEEFLRQFDAPQQPRTQESSGSGFIVSRDGYILTNNHVVEGADRIKVALQDRRVFDAKVVGRDSTTDVAVLKVEAENLTTITFGDDDQLRVGEWVLAIGNPLGLDFTVTAGIVSAKGRGALTGLQRSQYDIADFIQTDAAINPGNSGGPLVNARGEVVGINSAIASQTGYYSGYGFAIPITLAKQVMDDLIAHGEVRRAVIGVSISEVTPEDAAAAGLESIAGVKVGGFSSEESPALRAGIEPGDVLVKADGKPVDRVSALQRVIRGHKPGDVVTVEAMRFGSRKTFQVRLGAVPRAERAVAATDDAPATRAPATNARLGVSVEPVSTDFAKMARVPEAYRGIRVTAVEPGGPAEARLGVGDVLAEVLPAKKKLGSVADLQQALAAVRSGQVISFLVYRPNPEGTGATTVVSLRLR